MFKEIAVYLIMGGSLVLMGAIILGMLFYVAGPRRKPVETRSFLQRIADIDGLFGGWVNNGRGADG